MTNFIGWTPPPGAVVDPPVHPETIVDVIYSDGERTVYHPAHAFNWSSVGDGPSIVAYAVVEEYKPAPGPKDYWIAHGFSYVSEEQAVDSYRSCLLPPVPSADEVRDKIIHVREVPDPSREMVAWAVVRGDDEYIAFFRIEGLAHSYAKNTGGTVVKLSGVMPHPGPRIGGEER